MPDSIPDAPEHSAHDAHEARQATHTGEHHDAAGSRSAGGGGRHAGHSVADFRRRFWVCLALTVPVLLLEPLPFLGGRPFLAVPGADVYLLVLGSLIYLFGGKPFLAGLVRELRARTPGMMTLVAVAITVAYGYSAATVFGLPGMPFFWELATLVDIMLLGHWVEMRSVSEASRALESLAKLMPAAAHRRNPDGTTTDVSLQSLDKGDVVVVRPGETLPADGSVLEGSSAVDEALLTGESMPAPKKVGDEVIGGSINGRGALVVSVTRTGAESFLSQVIDLVREAQASKSQTQDLADRAATVLTVVALGGGAATLATWAAIGRPLAYAIERAVTVMVIACPHALGLAIPLVVAVSTALAARRGLLVRNRSAFENARLIDAVIFDKTGTLTLGRFGVERVVTFGELASDEVLSLAAAVEQFSEHPVARAIADAVPAPGGDVTGFSAIPGQGAQAEVDGRLVAVVGPGYLAEAGLEVPAPTSALGASASDATTMAYVVRDGVLEGAVAVSDTVRPESLPAIRRLSEMGVETIMLTGDSESVAARVAAELGITRFYAGVLPAEKAAVVARVRAEGKVVAMVGDGINDAPALASADVGIAIGAGTEVAIAAADVVLVRSNPADVVAIIELARATYRKMTQNLAWATGYNVIAIPLAAGVLASAGILLSPAVGGALMAASTVIVAINARTLKARG